MKSAAATICPKARLRMEGGEGFVVHICADCGYVEGEFPQAGCCAHCGLSSDPLVCRGFQSPQPTRSDVPPDPSPEDAPFPKPHYGRDDFAILARFEAELEVATAEARDVFWRVDRLRDLVDALRAKVRNAA